MTKYLFALALSFFPAFGFARDRCESLFEKPAAPLVSPDIQSSRDLQIKLSAQLSEAAIRKNATAHEGAQKRNASDAPQLRSSVEKMIDGLKELADDLRKDREHVNSPYPKNIYNKMIKDLNAHIRNGKNILKRKKLFYRDAIFYIYRGGILTYNLRAADHQQIPKDAIEPLTTHDIQEFIDESLSFEQALSYAHENRNDLTENFLMLNDVLNNPALTIYFMNAMPNLRELDEGLPDGIMYMTFLFQPVTFHSIKKFPPFSIIFHDVVHAQAISKNMEEIFKRKGLDISNMTLRDSLNVKLEIRHFLKDMRKMQTEFPDDYADAFELVFNYFTHYYFYSAEPRLLRNHPLMFQDLQLSGEKSLFVQNAMTHLSGMYSETYQRGLTNQKTQQIYQVLQTLLDFGINYRPHDDVY
jgi:hypothetical protein